MVKTRQEETVIAHGVRVEGEFVSQGDVLIEGEVIGNIKTEGDLRVGESSIIQADVAAKNAVVGGQIRGNVQISGRLELLASAKVLGDITADVLSVAAGAKVNGKLTMTGEGLVVEMDEDESEEE